MVVDAAGRQAGTWPTAARSAVVCLLLPTRRPSAVRPAAPPLHLRDRNSGSYPFCCQAIRRFGSRTVVCQ
jgi:hypothetical protein